MVRAICEKCKNYEAEIQGCLYMDADCVNGSEFEPFTNYDQIKNMTVDEMAEFLFEYGDCDFCPVSSKCKIRNYENCKKNIKKWLESEVVE